MSYKDAADSIFSRVAAKEYKWPRGYPYSLVLPRCLLVGMIFCAAVVNRLSENTLLHYTG